MEHNFHDEQNNVQNLNGPKAIEKLKQIAEDARTCMFITFSDSRPLPSRPMALQTVDTDGKLYFFSAKNSDKNHEIKEDAAVQLVFLNNGSSEYLSVFGTAKISQDRAKIRELWSAWAKAWFQDGPDDPNLSLITVQPEESMYWDTKHNKMVQLMKIAASIVTGKTMDDGVEGKLTV